MATKTEKRIQQLIAENEAIMAGLVEIKPTVTYAGSDGRRVKYVKAETTVAVLREIAATLKADR